MNANKNLRGLLALILLLTGLLLGCGGDQGEGETATAESLAALEAEAAADERAKAEAAEAAAIEEAVAGEATAEFEATKAAEEEMTRVAGERAEATAQAEASATAEQNATATAVAQASATAQAEATATAEAQATATAQAQATATALFQAEKLAIVAEVQENPPFSGPREGTMPHNDDDNFESALANVNLRDFVVAANFTTDSQGSSDGKRDIGFLFRDTNNAGALLDVQLDGFWDLSFWDGEAYVIAQEGFLDNLNTDASPNELIVYAEGEEGMFFANGIFISELDLSQVDSAGDIGVMTGCVIGNEVPGEETAYEAFSIWVVGELPAPPPTPVPAVPPPPPISALREIMVSVRMGMESFGGMIDTALGGGTIYCVDVVNTYDFVISAPVLDLSGGSAAEQNANGVFRASIALFADGTRDMTQNCRDLLASPDTSTTIPFQQWALARQRVNEALDLMHQAEQVLG